jgi:hypothetical protein
MSWLTPIVREIMADKAMTDHKLAFMENAATPNMVVKLDVQDLDKFTKWMQQFKEDHEGARNAYRTVFLGAGADVTVVGADLKQIDFKVTQGAGETRIAAAAGVPPVIVGLSEGCRPRPTRTTGRHGAGSRTERSGLCGGTSAGRSRTSSPSLPARSSPVRRPRRRVHQGRPERPGADIQFSQVTVDQAARRRRLRTRFGR